ncbi:D-alanyl-D-alanine carboxypeptidase/D-alanyl-D-alanine-endopeptidase [Celeribacter sp.]|uniref:D-alanyl-D-alanine carboxypeptidase/D-alanyl-D-alanine endopeptidase n=1 Tax=Celeribacter sp. TaxID=1890673 RepID=UPI003A91BF6A
MLGGIFGATLTGAAPLWAEAVTRSPFPVPRPDGFYKKAIPSAEEIVAKSGVSGAVSFALVDPDTGEFTETRDPIKRLPPASVAKTVTALYALETLGTDHRFTTRVMATGPVAGGVVQGDLVLVGGGDPTLDTDMLGGLAEELRGQGITGVTGAFQVWDGALPRIEEIDGTQTEYAGYNPTISGLNLNFNRVHFEWRRQGADYSLKLDARAERFAPDVRIARVSVAARDVPVFDHEAGAGRDEWSVARSALGGGGARWLPVRLPALYAGEVFQAVARMQGLRLPAPVRAAAAPAADAVELARHESAPLTVIARDMLKYSTNLTAEVLGLTASLARGHAVTDLATSARAQSEWARARFGMRHLDLKDHSGLGGASVVTASDMARMLASPLARVTLLPILKPVGLPTADGSAVDPDHPVKVVAKTGTLDFVSALAGYVTTPDGRTLAFAIFAGDLPARVAAKASGAEVPRGARTFNSRAKKLHRALLARWGLFHAQVEHGG